MNREKIIFISITCLVIIIWVVADIVHSQTNVVLDPELEKVLEPFDPIFDTEALKIISEEVVAADFTPVVIPATPAPLIIPTPVASVSATISPSALPTSTPSSAP